LNRFVRMVAVATSVVVVVGGTAGASVGAKAKKVSPEKYAKNLCGVYGDVTDRLNKWVEDYNAISSDDPVAFHTEAVAGANELIDDITALQKKLKKKYPDVDGGKKVNKLFVDHIDELLDEVNGAVDKFEAADPNDVAFVGDVTTFEVAFNVLSTTLSDPFSDVDDQDLLKAFDGEKSCKDVVTIFGG
jgi:hypothetical protein